MFPPFRYSQLIQLLTKCLKKKQQPGKPINRYFIQNNTAETWLVSEQNGSLFRKLKKKTVINTPFKYKTNQNKEQHDIQFAYQRATQ